MVIDNGVTLFLEPFDASFFSDLSDDVEEMGYKDPEDADMDWLLDEDEYVDGTHFVIRFGNDACLMIASAEVMAEIVPPRVTALPTE